MNATDIPESHKAFFKNQLLYYIDEQNRCFVHAGFERTLPFFSQEDESYYFNRTLWIEALEFKKIISSIQL
ncbi:hypothetical protein [Sphingobacterium sp. UGAL515B_05]|uniref:hypothetical protein n=1 Tax=Sphingobacterium sp. UGAL515B_05 TaxID=2986767 RepID=UPI002952A31E|nr:hypothetical protein [Sphingobacterium sp. UGAL515B_05]WON93822.1 hypothetical protein OK025_21550 [Sphingobacterium sp. UGAL515B_05]